MSFALWLVVGPVLVTSGCSAADGQEERELERVSGADGETGRGDQERDDSVPGKDQGDEQGQVGGTDGSHTQTDQTSEEESYPCIPKSETKEELLANDAYMVALAILFTNEPPEKARQIREALDEDRLFCEEETPSP